MKLRTKAKTTSASSAATLPASALRSHASKTLLIDIDNISVRLGAEKALQNVSLCVHTGEFIGLIGPNGAGKTTLLKVMLGLLTPQTGTCKTVGGQIGYVPQRGTLVASQVPMSVKEVVQLGSRTHALQALQQVGLQNLANRRFAELSGGQQQRVLIAKALAAQPSILMLDEPTTGIDEQSQADFYELLRALQAQGITIVMVSHDIDAVLKIVTRVICLNHSVLYDGPPQHFEADKYLPKLYTTQHRMLHHQHGVHHV